MAAAACVAAFLVLLAVVYTTDAGRHGRPPCARTASASFSVRGSPSSRTAIAHLADPVPFALLGARARRRRACAPRPARRVSRPVLVLLGANVTTQVLKPLLANPRGTFGDYGVAAEAFPSGHATAAMSLALVAVVVAPRRLRPLVAFIGAGFALSVGFAIVSLDWHFPSDVAGGYLVAAAWCFAGARGRPCARTRRAPRAGARRSRSPGGSPAATLLVPLAVVGWLALERLPRITGYAEGHTTFAACRGGTARARWSSLRRRGARACSGRRDRLQARAS